MQQAEDSEKWRLEKQKLESQQSALNVELETIKQEFAKMLADQEAKAVISDTDSMTQS